MAAADDTVSNQDDLFWDHSGDVESDPLLGAMSRDVSRSGRPESLQLSYNQACDLLKVLDNTRYVLDNFVHHQVQDSVSGDAVHRSRSSWTSHICFPACRRKIAKYILLITVFLQAINLAVVSIIDVFHDSDDHQAVVGACATMIVLQVLNLLFVLMVSLRLVRQLSKHKVSLFLLVQAYIATLLLFAGIYTLAYRIESESWKFIEEPLSEDAIQVILLYCKFLFYSVSTATLCGSDNVLPRQWYTCIFVAAQMLMSFVYFASILGQTLSQYWLGFGHRPHDHCQQHTQQQNHSSPCRQSSRVSGNSGFAPPFQQHYGSGDTTSVITAIPRTHAGDTHTPVLSIEPGSLSINTSES